MSDRVGGSPHWLRGRSAGDSESSLRKGDHHEAHIDQLLRLRQRRAVRVFVIPGTQIGPMPRSQRRNTGGGRCYGIHSQIAGPSSSLPANRTRSPSVQSALIPRRSASSTSNPSQAEGAVSETAFIPTQATAPPQTAIAQRPMATAWGRSSVPCFPRSGARVGWSSWRPMLLVDAAIGKAESRCRVNAKYVRPRSCRPAQ